MTDKERADVLRKAVDIMADEWGGELSDYIKEYADELDPPYKLDRSLRGWVMVQFTDARHSVYHAREFGLAEVDGADDRVILRWDDIERYGYKVTQLRILQPGKDDLAAATRERYTGVPEAE